MRGLIRPEAAAALARWREVIAAAAALLFGVWALGAPGPVVKGVGVVAIVVGAGLLVIALRRRLFLGSGEDPGVVSLDEGRIAYFGPHYGGMIDVPALTEIRLRREGGKRSWLLIAAPTEALAIPHGARDAGLLFDVFASLPHFDTDAALRELQGTDDASRTVWRRSDLPGLTSPSSRDSR